MRKRKMSAAEAKLNDEKKQEGREAFEKGMPVESCPYESAFDLKRWAWIWGWHDSANIKKAQEEADRAFLLEAERRGFVPKSPPPESKGLDLEAENKAFKEWFEWSGFAGEYEYPAREGWFARVGRLRAGAEGGGRPTAPWETKK